MKKLKRTALLFSVMLLTVMCFAFSASAEDLFEGDYRYSVSNGEATLVLCSNLTEEELTLPETLGGYPLKVIGRESFFCNAKKIIIPDCVREIKSEAFDNSNFREIYIGSGVEIIGDAVCGTGSVFYTEKVLTEKITVSPDNKYFSSDENGVLYNKDKTELIDYPNSNRTKNYVLPESVTSIRDDAFKNSHYIEEFTFTENFTSVQRWLLADCENLKKVNFTDKIIAIEDYAFANCDSLSAVTLPGNLKKIGAGAFQNCPKLEYLEIPDSVTYIGEGAFSYSGFKAMEIPEGIAKLEEGLFADCSALEAVVLPSSVKAIGDKVFAGCDKFKYLYYTGTAEELKKITIGGNNDDLYNAQVYLVVLVKAPAKVTSTQKTNEIKLSWSAVKGVTGYRVYYKTSDGWKKCATTTSTSHTFKNLPAGKKYTFAVKSYYINPDKSVTWSDNYTTHETSTKALAPAKVTNKQNTSQIRLDWTACAGATGYRIYFKSGNEWKVAVSTTDKTTHIFSNLKPGARFTFAVRPYIKTNDTFIWCDYTTCVAATVPEAPAVTVTAPNAGQINLSWNAVRGAAGYNVYYKINNGAYKFYKTYKNAGTYTFNNLQGGNTFTFVVRAGIKTTSGNIWSSYTENSVKLAYRIDRYNNAVAKGSFYMEVYDEYGIYNGMAMKNGNFCYDMKADGERERIVYRSDTNMCYVISDTYKEYYAAPDDGSTKELVESMISLDSSITKYKTSQERIGSKTYFVESYIDAEGFTVKYYFDGINLAKEALVYQGEEVYMLSYSKFTNKVPDSLFEIPSGYKKLEIEE